MNDRISLTKNTDIYCSDLSRERGESMAGSALRVDVWFVLEYEGLWQANAIEDNDLHGPVKAWLGEQTGRIPNSRVQFIKRNQPDSKAGLNFFVALAKEIDPRIYRFRIDDYDGLLQLNLPDIVSQSEDFDEFLMNETLYLVCTNGKRDRCCARFGLSLYSELVELAGESVWQTTHLGGHRFGPTLVTLPDGACYGRLNETSLGYLVQAQERGDLSLDHLRGRSCYDSVSQAAEIFLRGETGVVQREGLRHLGQEKLADSQWVVAFLEPATGKTYKSVITQNLWREAHPVSCSPLKLKPVYQYKLVRNIPQ